ncbi:hypothetical protein LXA43DRAFT_1108278 [Ganoderma leucocontextum]|nr:hypothetical protein LXA43DRAFT_1108278 [Ganoderma leucocontextum]
MSANQTTSAPTAPPGGISTVASAVDMLIVGTFFPALLVPIAAVLFFFSTPKLRPRPLFILNVLAIVFALGLGGIIIYNVKVGILLQPLDPGFALAQTVLLFAVPMLTQSILVIRVFAVYPPPLLSWSRIFLIYTPIVALKVARVVNIVIFVIHINDNIKNNPFGGLDAGPVSWSLPYAKVEWFLQVFDDSYVSCLFLLRLREGRKLAIRTEPQVSVVTNRRIRTSPSRTLSAARIKALFWIAVFNFVFPVLFNIAQLILIFNDRNFVHGTMVQFANNFLLVTSVLFATIWCSESSRTFYGAGQGTSYLTKRPNPRELPIESTPQFACGSETATQIQLSDMSTADYSVKATL